MGNIISFKQSVIPYEEPIIPVSPSTKHDAIRAEIKKNMYKLHDRSRSSRSPSKNERNKIDEAKMKILFNRINRDGKKSPKKKRK